MNTPVIATQLKDAVRKLSPAARIEVVEHPMDQNAMWFVIDVADAVKMIDFINDHIAVVPADPNAPQLFDPAGY
jgi:hypothetical protein